MADPRRNPLAWLIPRADEPGADLARRTQLRMGISLVMANVLGAAIVFSLAVWVLPPVPGVDESEQRIVNLIALGAFFVVATPIAIAVGRGRLRRASGWLLEDREPTPDERRAALRMPRRIVAMHAFMWGLAT